MSGGIRGGTSLVTGSCHTLLPVVLPSKGAAVAAAVGALAGVCVPRLPPGAVTEGDLCLNRLSYSEDKLDCAMENTLFGNSYL